MHFEWLLKTQQRAKQDAQSWNCAPECLSTQMSTQLIIYWQAFYGTCQIDNTLIFSTKYRLHATDIYIKTVFSCSVEIFASISLERCLCSHIVSSHCVLLFEAKIKNFILDSYSKLICLLVNSACAIDATRLYFFSLSNGVRQILLSQVWLAYESKLTTAR